VKTLLLYSDKRYEEMLESFLISRRYANLEHIPVIYYSIGFDSNLEYPNLIKVRWEFDERKEGLSLNYYKPDIILDSLKYSYNVKKIIKESNEQFINDNFNIDSFLSFLCSKFIYITASIIYYYLIFFYNISKK
jgi:hypothetical protein